MTELPNGMTMLKHPLIVALVLGVVGTVAWKAVSEYRQTALEHRVTVHTGREAHEGADRRLTTLETHFGYIQRELQEIKDLLKGRTLRD